MATALLGGLLACVLLGVCESSGAVGYDALVSRAADERPQGTEALPRFATINGALNAGFTNIAIASGDYYEKVTVSRDGVSLTGLGSVKPRLFFDAYAGESAAYHRNGWGTAGSATLTIHAAKVRLHNLRIENRFDFLTNDALPELHPDRHRHSQAVALLLDKGSGLTYVTDSEIHGFQDTLFADGGRALFERTVISGNVDYIFGGGLAVFSECEIRTRPRGREFGPGEVRGYVTAPSTDKKQPYGLIFINARFTRDAGVPDASISLGRPWHPTTVFSDGRYADPNALGSVVLIDSELGAHILPQGWSSMRGTSRDGTKSLIFTPEQSRFYESGSRGPGAQKHPGRKTLQDAERRKLLNFVAGLKSLIAARP